MGCRLVICAVVIAALGCKDSSPAAPTDPPGSEPADDATSPAENTDAPTGPAPANAEPSAGPSPSPTGDAAAVPVAEPEAAPSPRDLAAELRTAVGNPVDCLRDFRPSTPRTIRVDIGGEVRPTGMIIEPTASAAGLSTNDRRCIQQRVGAVTLAPLAGTTSEKVTTAIELQYVPPASAEVEEYDVNPPPPPQKNVVEPLPKKKPIAPSGVPIEGPKADPIEGPEGVPIEGPEGTPIEGPKSVPIGSDL